MCNIGDQWGPYYPPHHPDPFHPKPCSKAAPCGRNLLTDIWKCTPRRRQNRCCLRTRVVSDTKRIADHCAAGHRRHADEHGAAVGRGPRQAEELPLPLLRQPNRQPLSAALRLQDSTQVRHTVTRQRISAGAESAHYVFTVLMPAFGTARRRQHGRQSARAPRHSCRGFTSSESHRARSTRGRRARGTFRTMRTMRMRCSGTADTSTPCTRPCVHPPYYLLVRAPYSYDR